MKSRAISHVTFIEINHRNLAQYCFAPADRASKEKGREGSPWMGWVTGAVPPLASLLLNGLFFTLLSGIKIYTSCISLWVCICIHQPVDEPERKSKCGCTYSGGRGAGEAKVRNMAPQHVLSFLSDAAETQHICWWARPNKLLKASPLLVKCTYFTVFAARAPE